MTWRAPLAGGRTEAPRPNTSPLHLIKGKGEVFHGSYPQQQKPSYDSKQVREYLHLKPGDRFKFFLQPDGVVVILPKIPTARLKGSLQKGKRPISVETMNGAIRAGATESARR